MKINIKNLSLYAMLGIASVAATSCDDLLDMDPVSQITPESYYNNADQLASYLNSYYNAFLQLPFNGNMYHDVNSWNDGLARSDRNTDIFVQDVSGNTTLFANDHWEVSAGKNLQGYYGNFRVCNYFLERALPAYEAKKISGDDALIRNYIGEAYFLRAVNYFNTMVKYGDLPIITTVLEDNDAAIIEASKRAPRNEVARFILADLDKAIGFLAERGKFKGQRINKETALLFKSRVALFEGTFEKYHKGSGRVPGDANWPGAKMSYNSGKSFDIDAEVRFFLTEAMNAAKQVADNAQLTENSHAMNPESGTVYGWNSYFEMYSQPSLANVPEVLLWKEYSSAQNIKNGVPYRVKIGCADGYTRTFVETFLTKNGLPIYADNTYKGDVSIDNAKAGRDERLQLFVWGESDMLDSDPKAPTVGTPFTKPETMASAEPSAFKSPYFL
ncbi:RagB/SusD family nutrient uptake outer membrane protein [Bacteroides heparinolyticus]|uniref:RagB/SusD family nutrient uptake outer membrane protein n=1 Tax=Prevotella heparinolytica TaxID=28113 RepID=UPI0035A0C4FB